MATVAHEFRTPLTSLRMAIHLCSEEAVGPLTPKQADLLFAAREDCERLQAIVDELLDLSRIQAGRSSCASDRRSLPSAGARGGRRARSEAKSASVDLRSRCCRASGDVMADPERIQIVFSNLLANAIRHSPPRRDGGRARRAPDGWVRFEVSDRAPASPPEHQQRHLRTFYRRPAARRAARASACTSRRRSSTRTAARSASRASPARAARFWFSAGPEQSDEASSA